MSHVAYLAYNISFFLADDHDEMVASFEYGDLTPPVPVAGQTIILPVPNDDDFTIEGWQRWTVESVTLEYDERITARNHHKYVSAHVFVRDPVAIRE